MALTEEQKSVARKVAMGMDDEVGLSQRTTGWWPVRFAERFLAALPKPEADIPDVLFDGYSVLSALDEHQRARTSPENISDTLDAVVRLLRAEAPLAQPDDVPCEKCGQVPQGQSGIYECSECGLPLVHDSLPECAPSEQKPVAYMTKRGAVYAGSCFGPTDTPLYPAPPTRLQGAAGC